MLVIPLSQHYASKMIIVFLWRQSVKLYDKESFVLFPWQYSAQN
jgi:hypothetical protein